MPNHKTHKTLFKHYILNLKRNLLFREIAGTFEQMFIQLFSKL